MRTYTFIINPMAGKGRGRKLLGHLQKSIRQEFPGSEILLTEKKMHAFKLASERKNNPDTVIVAVGGDGTVNEVGNGIIGGSSLMSVVPIGSGNDFVKMFSIPTSPEKALAMIKKGKPRLCDAGRVVISTNDTVGITERYFLNGIGIGFDAAVANQTTRYKYLKGFPLYIVSVARTLMSFSTPNMLMSVNGLSVNGQHFLIAVGNGKCAGGGFYLTPEAEINDGLLDICLVDNLSIPRVLKIFPSVLSGKHKKHKEVHFYKSEELVVTSQQPIMVHADGEVLATQAREIHMSVQPSVLKILA
jgi:diacylglycerol kinase (ATP)